MKKWLKRRWRPPRRLSFTHPVTGAVLDVRAPPPADLAQALDAWGLTIPTDDAAAD